MTAPSSAVLQAEMVKRPNQVDQVVKPAQVGRKKSPRHSRKASNTGKQASLVRAPESMQQRQSAGQLAATHITEQLNKHKVNLASAKHPRNYMTNSLAVQMPAKLENIVMARSASYKAMHQSKPWI